MEHTVTQGIQGFQTKIVEKKNTAKALGSGLAEVFATPALVALMENAAFQSIEPHLPKGFSSVGIQINVSHIKASLPGAIISCTSTVTNVEGKKVFFSIEASDNVGPIGTAEHIRYIIESETFIKKLQEKK